MSRMARSTTTSTNHVVGDNRDFYVYTPPDYDPTAKTLYPVLYLLHGFSDDASGWTAVGRAHVILDNLIAQGKAIPMLVVMPLGYGAPEMLDRNGPSWRDRSLVERNFSRFRDALLTEVIPQVEKIYRAAKDRDSLAIAGLSMGGSESRLTASRGSARSARVACARSLTQPFRCSTRRQTSKSACSGSLAAPTTVSSRSIASFATGSSPKTSATRISKRPAITPGWSGGGTSPSLPGCYFRTRRPEGVR